MLRKLDCSTVVSCASYIHSVVLKRATCINYIQHFSALYHLLTAEDNQKR